MKGGQNFEKYKRSAEAFLRFSCKHYIKNSKPKSVASHDYKREWLINKITATL